MKVLFYFPLLVLVYLVFARLKYGMTRSISASYGRLNQFEKLLPFMVMALGVVIPSLILGGGAAHGKTFAFLWWVSGFCILAVGVYPVVFAGTYQEIVHVAGATGGIIAGMLAAALTLPGWWNVVIPVLFGLFVGAQEVKRWNIKLKNNTYWTEVLALVIIMGLLLIYYKNV